MKSNQPEEYSDIISTPATEMNTTTHVALIDPLYQNTQFRPQSNTQPIQPQFNPKPQNTTQIVKIEPDSTQTILNPPNSQISNQPQQTQHVNNPSNPQTPDPSQQTHYEIDPSSSQFSDQTQQENNPPNYDSNNDDEL